MRPDLSQERTTDLYLHFQPFSFISLPYLFSLLLVIRGKGNAMRGKKGGGLTYPQRNSGRGKESTLLLGGKK